MHAFMEAWNGDLVESGSSSTLVVWLRRSTPGGSSSQNGVPVVTDGPYPETEEVLAGYTIVECDSFDRATEIAALLAKAPYPPDAPGSSWSMCDRSTKAAATWTSSPR